MASCSNLLNQNNCPPQSFNCFFNHLSKEKTRLKQSKIVIALYWKDSRRELKILCKLKQEKQTRNRESRSENCEAATKHLIGKRNHEIVSDTNDKPKLSVNISIEISRKLKKSVYAEITKQLYGETKRIIIILPDGSQWNVNSFTRSPADKS